MWIAEDERASVARLLGLLGQGEEVAAHCAKRQAAVAPTRGMRRFLAMQTKHERFHSSVIQGGILCLRPRGAPEHDASRYLKRYRRLLEAALDRGRFAESLLGQQVILEGWADVVLTRVSDGMVERGLGFERIRHLLLGQEDAHHSFGLMSIEKLVARGEIDPAELRQMSEPYIGLLNDMVSKLGDLFEFFGEVPADYVEATYAEMPSAWVDETAFTLGAKS